MESADAALRRAHEAGYRFPQGFAGFTASFTTSSDQGPTSGTVSVDGRRSIELTLDGTPGPDADWTRDEIASIVGHRWPTPYEEGDGRFTKQVSGDTVALHDAFDSSYRLGAAGVHEVRRTTGSTRFVIVVADRHLLEDGRHLPSHFTVFYWDVESGRLLRADHFRDTYVAVDGVYLPGRREVTTATDTGLATRVLDLTDHVLAVPAPAVLAPAVLASDEEPAHA